MEFDVTNTRVFHGYYVYYSPFYSYVLGCQAFEQERG